MRWIRLHFFDVGDDALRVKGLLSQKKKRNMVTRDSYNFLKRVSKHACKRYRLFFFYTGLAKRTRGDRQSHLLGTIRFTPTSGRTYRSRERNSTLDRLDRLVRRLYLVVRVSSKLLIMPRTRPFPWRGAHENIDKRRSNRGELVKGEEDICGSIDLTVGGREDIHKGEDERRTMPRGGGKGTLRAGPLPSSFVPGRGHRVRKGEPP